MADNGAEFFAGLLIGALAGAAAALVLTPCSGESVRNQLRERGEKVRDQVEQVIGEVRSQSEDVVEDLRAQTDRLGERGRIVLSENVRKAQEVVQQAQQKLESQLGDTSA